MIGCAIHCHNIKYVGHVDDANDLLTLYYSDAQSVARDLTFENPEIKYYEI